MNNGAPDKPIPLCKQSRPRWRLEGAIAEVCLSRGARQETVGEVGRGCHGAHLIISSRQVAVHKRRRAECAALEAVLLLALHNRLQLAVVERVALQGDTGIVLVGEGLFMGKQACHAAPFAHTSLQACSE
jgi:hypothetical protein